MSADVAVVGDRAELRWASRVKNVVSQTKVVFMVLLVASIEPSEATGATKALYEYPRAPIPAGEVPNYVRAWSLQPEVAESWLEHGRLARLGAGIDDRQYEVLCIRVAYNFKCASVLRNHAWLLLQQGRYSKEEILQIAHSGPDSTLGEQDRTMLAFADKMSHRSTEIDAVDMQRLRDSGFSDAQIVALVMLIGWRVSDAVNGNAFGLGDGDVWTTEMQEVIDWR